MVTSIIRIRLDAVAGLSHADRPSHVEWI